MQDFLPYLCVLLAGIGAGWLAWVLGSWLPPAGAVFGFSFGFWLAALRNRGRR